MKIRPARPGDLPSINKIYNQAVRQLFSTAHLEPVEMKERELWYRSHDPERYPVFVAEDRNQVCGWVSLGPYREGRQALSHVAEVSYYVDEEERGKGIGSLVLDYVLEAAPHYGFSVLVAILLDKNPASMALLEKFNFECWGTMPGIARIHGQVADHLYYGLKL